ncbi:MAG TPA: PqiC family protein, partial [Candidatus Binataceae bacterium]|nr:PqiC family protein [Candidatus Binataceae bacterium]
MRFENRAGIEHERKQTHQFLDLAKTIFSISFRSLAKFFFALSACLAFAACSVLSPKQDRTRFIVLTPVAAANSNGPELGTQKSASMAIGLGPVQFPEYLDRPELVIRTSPNAFELSEVNRWAEPLADNFRHVLANDLTNILGTANIVQYPWYPGTRLDYIVTVQVQRFEGDTAQTAELNAKWELSTASNQILASRQAQFSRPTTSTAGDAIAGALSADLGELAQQIASAIVQADQ